MGTTKYEQEDIIPIVLHVLMAMYCSYICIAFKIMVEFDLKDLRHIVATDRVDDTSMDLLRLSNRDSIKAIWKGEDAIDIAVGTLANIYVIDLDSVYKNTRIKDLAERIYLHLVKDDFPDDGSRKRLSKNAYVNRLIHYSLSLIGIVSSLGTLVKEGQLNFETVWVPDGTFSDFPDDKDEQCEHVAALELLNRLGRALSEYHQELS